MPDDAPAAYDRPTQQHELSRGFGEVMRMALRELLMRSLANDEWEAFDAAIRTAAPALLDAADRADALERFKSYVHQRLDQAGIPTHPNGPHSKEGCRVGDRLDIALVGCRAAGAATPPALVLDKVSNDFEHWLQSRIGNRGYKEPPIDVRDCRDAYKMGRLQGEADMSAALEQGMAGAEGIWPDWVYAYRRRLGGAGAATLASTAAAVVKLLREAKSLRNLGYNERHAASFAWNYDKTGMEPRDYRLAAERLERQIDEAIAALAGASGLAAAPSPAAPARQRDPNVGDVTGYPPTVIDPPGIGGGPP